MEGTDLTMSKAKLAMRKSDKNFDGKLDKKEFSGVMNARHKRKNKIS